MKNTLLVLFLLPQLLWAQIQVSETPFEGKSSFALVSPQTTASIYVDSKDVELVQRTARLLASDIERVTGIKPDVATQSKRSKGNVVIIGTIGQNAWIDRLIAQKRLNVGDIQGQWERYAIQVVEKPFKGVDKALVVAGSDRRGTAYGAFSLSEAMGVSPWYWWADVPVTKRNHLYIHAMPYVSKAPSVKYRGVFLNDEDWGLHPWAAKHIDPEVGDIGPNTYEKVFELLLRLKANMMAPAMHECTKAFYTVPGNMEMAEAYGIMVTTSHCEPLLYNNASEWNKETQGEWNYASNKQQIVDVLDRRVNQAHKNENLYTIALRGMHDEGMKGDSDEEKLQMLDQAIKDQRGLLAKYIDQPVTEIPQIFVPYKEVLGLYEKGLELPEDITLVWPDDNYGYIKKLSNQEERKRAGGSGVYYHISYLGWPNDYLWLNTTPPALMYAEMHKAYSLGADTYWLLNVGDIKPGELGMQLFLDMAWDFDAFTFENINDHAVDLLASIFGSEYRESLAYILDRYYYHGFTRKPEYMTWDWKWNSIYMLEAVKDTEFSFVHYNEAETRLEEYHRISEMAKGILDALPEEKKAAFFELVYYPVKGASLYNHEMLIGQKNRWYARQGRSLTNALATDVRLYHDSLALLTASYNGLLDGKWDGMMTAPGFLPEVQLSPTQTIQLPQAANMEIQDMLTRFDRNEPSVQYFELYNTGRLPFDWKATTSHDWIVLNKTEGRVDLQDRISVSIDWAALPAGSQAHGIITLTDGIQTKQIPVNASGANVISLSPVAYQRKKEVGGIRFQAIRGLGYSNAALQLGNALHDSGDGSYVEYDFDVQEAGDVTIHTYMLPLFPIDTHHSTRYGVQVDDQACVLHHNDVKEYSMEWASNVIRNTAINQTTVRIDRPGKHTLRIYSVDPGMILQKIIIDAGGLKKSYIGPQIQERYE